MGIFSRFQISHGEKECDHGSEEGGSILPPNTERKMDPIKKIRIPLNKTVSDVKTRNGSLLFSCPVCEVLNIVPLEDIHPILGGQPMCQSCGDILHIPGGYKTGSDVSSLKIYAGLPVAIRKFFIFYQNHPVIHHLEEEGLTRIVIQYGIWGFCQKCHHEFSPGVLMNLPQTSCEVIDYRSLTSDEMIEMKSLRQGKCPYCDHPTLLVIISDVPRYVVSASENLSHRWEED
ncbi:MAG: hypothetical protein LUQ50_09340 [Methanospirillum sp.]|uniref:hypothetical protein n=1 Tax=Methanospirillum sp. TaxID=45200 RepID=UPI0023699B88|nr:hypothetical protein [Methanospirillum sp.]MDD1729262.1 hypothetical protein [Methanospirillum sp.]